ncbi:MAG: leucine-rich repeat domain-containing protein [Clostridia bacterium]|nr:leucine-rich repeat domain-containing protein [Clostridia bacterium]
MSHNYKYSYDYNQHWQVCSDCKTATEKEEHELALDDWYDGVCSSCNYHETIVEYSDTQWMVFSLDAGNNCWMFEGFRLPLSDLPLPALPTDIIELVIPAYYESPMYPEFGALPVTTIGPEALKGESKIRRVVLPSTIKYIESEAFADMPSLSHIGIREGVVHIGSQAFARCERLKEMQLPSTLDSNFGVAEDALDFSGIETLRLPPLDFPRDQNELQFLDLHYYNMPSLKKIDINGINDYYKFENNALYYKIGLRYSTGSEDNGSRLVTFIGDGSDIDFTAGYTSIEDCAFKNKQLANTDLYLSQELVCIGSKVFENCNVKTIHISAKIATAIDSYIRDDAFENANDLTDIYIECTKYDWSYLGKYVKLRSGVVVHCTDGNVVY